MGTSASNRWPALVYGRERSITQETGSPLPAMTGMFIINCFFLYSAFVISDYINTNIQIKSEKFRCQTSDSCLCAMCFENVTI